VVGGMEGGGERGGWVVGRGVEVGLEDEDELAVVVEGGGGREEGVEVGGVVGVVVVGVLGVGVVGVVGVGVV
ncbi:hypothetical protein, partial [Dermacoccus nishinomiyaensis]|uniref:hypothetical protein n=1 Tax=Dermacoccus nishinomiyaensis TaxID=1274 RepID=UPI001C92D882